MELTVNIKEQGKIAAFLNMIKEMDYVEIIDVKESGNELPPEHRALLEKRLKKVEKGESKFKDWDLIKKNYENKAI